MKNEINFKNFIKRSSLVHNNKYCYDNVLYENATTKVCIICPEHGEFWQTPHSHSQGRGCPECAKIKIGNKRRLGIETFLEKSKEIHGDRYDYSKVEYKDAKTKVCIICPKHGEFWQTPDNHLHKHGCPKCADELNSKEKNMTLETFLEKSKEIHGDRYDYSKVEYVNNRTKVCIICPEHGEFWQRPGSHLARQACPLCGNNIISQKLSKTTEEFTQKAKKVHKDKYNYSKVEYKNNHTKVCIICPKHGEFWQTPSSHLNGCGCPKCNYSQLEKNISKILKENNIKYIPHYRNKKVLALQELDFYLPEYNIAIECQGIQHFKNVVYFKNNPYKVCIKRDQQKFGLCKENGIKILYYTTFKEYNDFLGEPLYHTPEEILNEIIKTKKVL